MYSSSIDATSTTREIQGFFMLLPYQSGLLVHGCDMIEITNQQKRIDKTASLTISIILEGQLEFYVEQQHESIITDHPLHAVGFAITSNRPYHIMRCLHQGRRLRKVTLVVDQTYLYQQANSSRSSIEALDKLFLEQPQYWQWSANPQITKLAEQILAQPEQPSLLQNLYIENRALELLRVVLTMLMQKMTTFSQQRGSDAICAYIDENLHNIKSLQIVANAVGMSISTLQRQFKQERQQTVMQYIRQRKLENAQQALFSNSLSISEAAFMAGYHHVSNFIIAYKRAFGVTPNNTSIDS